MAEIDDDTPQDAAAGTDICFTALELDRKTVTAGVVFSMYDRTGEQFTSLTVEIDADPDATTDDLIARGHQRMRGILVEWQARIERDLAKYAKAG